MNSIHSTAVVDSKAEIGEDAEIGPYSVIGPNVRIGAKTRVMSHVVLDGHTTVGSDCSIYPFASIGTQSQDLKYSGGKTFVTIGDRNVIREYVTINSATGEGETTSLGSDCFLMAYCHLAHKCAVGNGVIMSNCAQLAGHVTVDDNAIIGGMVGVHQFVRIGKLAFIGGFSRIVQDVPPFLLVEGNPAVVRGINAVGLRRRNLAENVRSALKQACKILYRQNLSTQQALEKIRTELESCPELEHFVAFVEASERGIIK